MNEDNQAAISALLSRTGVAHDRYEREALGGQYDVEWPRWYAAYLMEHGLPALLGKSGDVSALNRPLDQVLAEADAMHRANAPNEKWPDYYARYLLDIANTL